MSFSVGNHILKYYIHNRFQTIMGGSLSGVLRRRGNLEAGGVVDAAVQVDDEDNLESGASHELRRHAADISETLDDHARRGALQAETAERLLDDDHAAASGGFGAPFRSAQRDGLAGDDGGLSMARVHRVGVHDPRHGLLVGVHVGRGYVLLPAADFGE